MTHPQIRWINEASEPSKTYRKMVVGWQSVLASLNATVLAFNSEYLKSEAAKDANPHHGMKEIAIKKMVIGALREIKPRLYEWYRELETRGVLSAATVEEKKRVKHVAAQVEKFDEVRNLAFHYGDPVEPTDSLLQLYQDIESRDIDFLNRVLRNLISLGECLKTDALAQGG
jgi:hypothetical protein